jgi:hypothetical protein
MTVTEPEGSSLCSKEPATCPIPEPGKASPHLTPYLFKSHFNTVHSIRVTSGWSILFKSPKLGLFIYRPLLLQFIASIFFPSCPGLYAFPLSIILVYLFAFSLYRSSLKFLNFLFPFSAL